MASRPIGTGRYYRRNTHHNTGLTDSFRGSVASEDLWNVYSKWRNFFVTATGALSMEYRFCVLTFQSRHWFWDACFVYSVTKKRNKRTIGRNFYHRKDECVRHCIDFYKDRMCYWSQILWFFFVLEVIYVVAALAIIRWYGIKWYKEHSHRTKSKEFSTTTHKRID